MSGERNWMGIAITLVVVALLSLIVAATGLSKVDQSEVCVLTTGGKVTGTAEAGWLWRIPGYHGKQCYSLQGVIYETSDNPETSRADFRDFAINAQTSDGQQITVKFSVRYRLSAETIEDVYRSVGKDMSTITERVVKFHSRSVVRLQLQTYTAEYLYGGDLFGVEQTIFGLLEPLFASSNVTIEAFTLRKIDFDPDYVAAIEQQQIAQERIETKEYDSQAAVNTAAETEALAKGEAAADIARASGRAESMRIEASAQAEANATIGASLRDNPEVLQWAFIQEQDINWAFLPTEGLNTFLPLDITGSNPVQP